MVVDNIEDYMSSIQKYKAGTGLENIADEEIANILIPTIWASVSHIMMTRCGLDARKEINIQEFSFIKNFDNNQIITILGNAISDISEMGLREIARTVTNLQKEEKNRNHTFVKNQKQEYSKNKEIEIGGIENGENRIHKSGRLQYAKSSDGERADTKWKFRKDEATLSKEIQESRIYDIIDGGQTSSTLNTNTTTSNSNGRANSTEISDTRENRRELENARPNEMDRTNEQLQEDSRRTSNDRLDLQLELLTEEEQKQNIAEAENASVFSFTQEMIDNVLKEGSHIDNGKFRIYEYLTRGLPEKDNVEFLKQEYGTGGRSADDNGVSEDHSSKGIKLSIEHESNSPTLLLNWKQVEKRIRELISADRYFNEKEKDEYFDWLDVNEIIPNNDEKQVKDEEYKLAERLHNYIMNYDMISYYNNFSLDNTIGQNIELLQADINDESNIQEYITFLKSALKHTDYDDELAIETRELIVQLENKLPNYEFTSGDIVYIGTDEFEIRTIDNEKVTLIDTSFPLFSKEIQREEFEKKIKENPANDKLRTGKKPENTKKSIEKIETQNNKQEENQNENTEKTLLERLHKFLNEYDIYDVDEVTLDEVQETLSDKQKILDTVDYFYEFLDREDILDEFSNELSGFIKELSDLYEEKDKITEQIKEDKPKEEKIKINIKKKRRNKIEYFDLHPEIALKDRNNYTIENNELGVGTPKEKFRRNIEAIKVLKKCTEENRYATPEEQEILSEYVGWGGLADAFEQNKDNWASEYRELKELLTEKEYEEARASSLTAFYTPPIVINSIYKALENMGLERGNLLEPSCRSRKLYGNATRKIK